MTQDTRKDRRVKIVSLNVRYKSATVDEFIENHAHDVSRGGIFIKTANPFPPGTLLKFEIRLASDQAVIAGVGRIVWKRDAGVTSGERPAGMGVKFIKIDEPSKAVIDRLVNTKDDAGKSFETTGDVTEAPVQTRSTPPGRPASGTSPAAGSASQKSAAPRSATPSAGMTAAPSNPQFRKATILGLGVAASEASAAPASSSPAPPGRTPFSSHPSSPPRPGGGGGAAMFPAGGAESMPAKEDQTVMRQAAELLEDALREAGGSMAEIGTNPLFSGSGPAPVEPVAAEARVAISTITPASEWTTADTPQALAATVAALRAEEAASHSPADSRRSEGARIASEKPTSSRSASAVTIEKGKSSAGTLLVVGIAAVFAIAGAVLFRDQLFGGGGAPEPVAAPTSSPAASAPPMPSVTSMASVTTVTIPPAETAASPTSQKPAPAAPAASASAGAASASAGAASASAGTASALVSAGSASASAASAMSSAAVIATSPPRTPKPVPPRMPAPAGDENAAGVAPTETGGSTMARPTAPAAKPAPPSAAKPAPPPKANPEKPTDDNPY